MFNITTKYLTDHKIDIENKYNYKIDDIINLLHFILFECYVQFNHNIFKQTHGIPMVTPCAPQLANLFLSYFENKFSFINNNIIIWKRYIDDVLLIWSGTKEDLDSFLNNYSKIHETIKINWIIKTDCTEFLDIYIIKEKCQLKDIQTNNNEILLNYNNMSTLQFKTHQKLFYMSLIIPIIDVIPSRVLSKQN